jgi:hypothetical protein
MFIEVIVNGTGTMVEVSEGCSTHGGKGVEDLVRSPGIIIWLIPGHVACKRLVNRETI